MLFPLCNTFSANRLRRATKNDVHISHAFIPQRIEYLQKHGQIPEAGVGMTITDKAPYLILAFNPKGPIGRTGMVKAGDQLLYVDDVAVGVLSCRVYPPFPKATEKKSLMPWFSKVYNHDRLESMCNLSLSPLHVMQAHT
jgi:hypothetical protein